MVNPGILAFAARHYRVAPEEMALTMATVRGGLCSTVSRVGVRFIDPHHRPRTARFIIKTVSGRELREIPAYESLVSPLGASLGPQLLGRDRLADGSARLYLEWVQSWRKWPWAEETLVDTVLDRLAFLHGSLPDAAFGGELRDWDYEAELQRSAEDTLAYFELVLTDPQHWPLKRVRAPMRRVVASLGRLRSALLADEPTVIHGDAHPGNVMVRLHGNRRVPVLLDWARVRLGSPLEDVNSWLQSLGFWDGQTRRRHDALVRRYLAARGNSGLLGSGFRDAYAVARASNALAGAMKYHLLNMTNPDNPEWLHSQSAAYVRDWGRGILRADACCRA
ncbi:MAG TPA: aminoglycoside phosphotransferase family protein [Bryobacteraceae bacterium]|nr:aminoglycoside phosphotransferase family protein [Bryobacteraceae bacterium]